MAGGVGEPSGSPVSLTRSTNPAPSVTSFGRELTDSISVKESIMTKSAFPSRRRYAPSSACNPFFALPFIARPQNAPPTNWNVPRMHDYDEACALGREYAGRLLQYLKDNPEAVGANLLGHIARYIDFADKSETSGCWVGFFSYLERVLHHGASDIDVFADVDRMQSR